MHAKANRPCNPVLSAIFQRRAIRAFEAVEIPASTRDLLLQSARQAPSSFNMQPYRLYWVESAAQRAAVARLCMSQNAAQTASALVVAVADIGGLRSTAQLQAAWMRQSGFPERQVREYVRMARIGRIIFMPGPLNLFGAFKGLLFGLLHAFKTMGSPPVTRNDMFKWAGKSTALACQNLKKRSAIPQTQKISGTAAATSRAAKAVTLPCCKSHFSRWGTRCRTVQTGSTAMKRR